MTLESVAFIALMVVGGVWYAKRSLLAGKHKLWRKSLERLVETHDFAWQGTSVRARLDDDVNIDVLTGPRGKHVQLRIRVACPPELAQLRLELTPASAPQTNAFDGAIRIDGDAGLYLALVGPDTRTPFIEALYDGWTFLADKSTCWYLVDPPHHVDALLRAIERGRKLAALTRTAFEQVPCRLATIVAQTQDHHRRLAALRTLVQHLRATPEADRALERALTDRAVEVRLFAALERLDFQRLLAITMDPNAAIEARRRAFDTILRDGRADERAALLTWHCQRPTPLSQAALSALHHVDRLDREHLLCAAVGDVHPIGTRVAALDALRQYGTVASIPVLSPMGDKRFAIGANNGRLHQAARDALTAIRARRDPHSPGGLALSEAQGGELSVSDDSRTRGRPLGI